MKLNCFKWIIPRVCNEVNHPIEIEPMAVYEENVVQVRTGGKT